MPEFESQQKATPFSLFSQPVIILGLVCLFSIFLTRADSFVFPCTGFRGTRAIPRPLPPYPRYIYTHTHTCLNNLVTR